MIREEHFRLIQFYFLKNKNYFNFLKKKTS